MSSILRPSPNETARMLQDEKQRRRQMRILQVREQEKMIAIRIRRAMQERREKEVNNLANILKKQYDKEHRGALKKSEEKFASCLKDVGSGHVSAKENAPNQALQDAIAEENQRTASDRGKNALQHQRMIRTMQEEESIEKRRKRHVALIKEKLRAKHIAGLPPPIPNPADTFFGTGTTTSTTGSWTSGSIPHCPGRYATIKISDHESTMPTTVSLGLPSSAVVERATAAEAATDARVEARKEGERINLLQAEKDRAVQECMEKAKVRHQAALEQARLGQESKDLMSDLKQLTLKDALRRQHHIEYKWEDNARGKRACQELFGPPGSRFQESELFSQDLQKSQDETPSCLEESSYDLTGSEDDTAGWKTIPKEEEESRPRSGALNRLLKQIESQRQQRNGLEEPKSSQDESASKNADYASSSEKSENAEDSKEVEEPSESSAEETSHPAVTRPHTVGETNIPEHDADSIHRVASPPKSPKSVQENAPELTLTSGLTQDTSGAPDTVKSRSESLLEKSLQSMRNDEALLKSVKEFQERLLQQHKSCAKIQEQIQRLEQKRAAIDTMVADVTKPKMS